MTTADTIRLDQLDARIRSVWGREQRLHLLAGGLAFVRWAVPLFLLGVFIDWMTYMPAAGRTAILATLLAVSLYRAWRCGWRNLRPFSAVRTALQLETHHGALQSLLVSAIQLRDKGKGGGGSIALRDRTCRLAEQAASGLRPEQAVPYQPLLRPGVVVAILLAIIGAFAVVDGPFFAAGATRIFTPWVAIQYPTDTHISLDSSELVVKEGDSAQIEARVAGEIPDQATIYVRTGEGRAREIDLDINDGSCVYNIASASRDFTYRIKAGDDRTGWHKVRVVPAPRIEKVKVDLAYPDYLGQDTQSIEALTLTTPEGTEVNWHITLDRPIRAAQYIADGEKPIDLPISDNGRSVVFAQGVSASRGYEFTWVDKEHGFRFTSPRYFLQVASDQAPRVELTSPSANLVAMIGRPLTLAVRAQDDHGIDATTITYRVNQRADQTVEPDQPVQSGQGDQPIDWDYRTALPDLAIGDTVSFMVQVRDRYPGPAGPHVVRSETRRITFLSKEQYLEQIQKQKDRLLSRVQTIYRQQRSAHEAVRSLTPGSDGYMQACQLEAIRQEMVRDQLNEIAAQMQILLDDLAANDVAGDPAGQSLETVRAALRDIAESHVARAATLLREQSVFVGEQSALADPAPAEHAVNTAARELAGLVLLRGIDSAQEVYAREARMLAIAQASLRWRAASNPSAGRASHELAQQQDELAQWTGRLITDLQAGMRYDKRPLAVLRLIRSVKELDGEQAEARMRQAGEMIRAGNTDQAASLQGDLVRTLLNAEFSVRISGAYSTLLRTRDELSQLTQAQSQLIDRSDAMSGNAFQVQRTGLAKQQTELRKRLLTLLLPTIPAPRARLFDQAPPKAPPVQALLAQADRAMAQALSQLDAGDQASAVVQQRAAEQALAELAGIVDQWSVQMGMQTQGLSTLVAATSERMSRIQEYEARVIGLLEKTDIASAQEEKVDGLTEPQMILADELAGLNQQLTRQNRATSDPDLPPLLSRLTQAEHAMNAAADALKDNDADHAIGQQEQAADALAAAYAVVLAQHERLALLQDLLMFQRAVGFANGYMADIVAQQRDLLAATESADTEQVARLMPMFNNMRQCMEQVAPLLDLVAGRLDVGTPLVFAQTDFADAMVSLTAGDKLDAIDAQDVAAQSLAEVQARVAAIQTQTGYVAEIVEYLHAATSDAAALRYQQDELKNAFASAKQDQRPALTPQQTALYAKAQQHGRQLTTVTGMPAFAEPTQQMRMAIEKLEASDPSGADEQMALAALALADNAELLFAAIAALHGLPSIEVSAKTEPELIRLIDVLTLASAHKTLLRETHAAAPQAMQSLADRQRDLATRSAAIAADGEPSPLLTAAHKHLLQSADAFASSDQDALRLNQNAADASLRHFIVQQALILETAIQISASDGDPGDDGEGSDSESALAAGFISDFVSGETPQDKRTEWKVLADRNRAALNQNFARELPLEYRRLLKNYYERVAK